MQPLTLIPWIHGLARTRIVTTVTIVSCAALAAHAVTAIVASGYLTPSTTAPALAARPSPPPPRPRAETSLVARGMFCSACAPGVLLHAGDFELAPAVLIETSLGAEPRATVHVLASEIQGSWGLGETIPGLGRVDRIAPWWIELEDATGRHSRLALQAATDGPGPARPADPVAATPWSARIKKIDDQAYEVDRSLVRELVSGSAARDAARLVPVVDHGQILGVRLFAVTDKTIPYAIGLRTGDQITAINDEPIKNAQQLLDLYAGLDQLKMVELKVARKGQPMIRVLWLR